MCCSAKIASQTQSKCFTKGNLHFYCFSYCPPFIKAAPIGPELCLLFLLLSGGQTRHRLHVTLEQKEFSLKGGSTQFMGLMSYCAKPHQSCGFALYLHHKKVNRLPAHPQLGSNKWLWGLEIEWWSLLNVMTMSEAQHRWRPLGYSHLGAAMCSFKKLIWSTNTKTCSTMASLDGQIVGPCMVRFIPDMQNVHHRDEDWYRVQLDRKWWRLLSAEVTQQQFWQPSLPRNTRTLWVTLLSGAFCYVQPRFGKDTGWRCTSRRGWRQWKRRQEGMELVC